MTNKNKNIMSKRFEYLPSEGEYGSSREVLQTCHSEEDGECYWEHCPQAVEWKSSCPYYFRRRIGWVEYDEEYLEALSRMPLYPLSRQVDWKVGDIKVEGVDFELKTQVK